MHYYQIHYEHILSSQPSRQNVKNTTFREFYFSGNGVYVRTNLHSMLFDGNVY